ncbi:MAG: class I SAM-dependent methyltransferase [Planctomycetaceae bacterium]|nr:class I SAM-dependent methyltransferase [Planctomycetaceae bacterium]
MARFTTDWFSHVIPLWKEYAVPRVVRGDSDGLEVGTYEGRSALWTLQYLLPQSHRRLYCLDLWEEEERRSRFQANVAARGVDQRIVQLQGPSSESLRKLPEDSKFDWIYIDGSHEARDCLTDAVLAFSRLSPGGVLVFDDYQWNARGRVHHPPRVAIDAFLHMWGNQIEILHIGYQVMISKSAKTPVTSQK